MDDTWLNLGKIDYHGHYVYLGKSLHATERDILLYQQQGPCW